MHLLVSKKVFSSKGWLEISQTTYLETYTAVFEFTPSKQDIKHVISFI